MMNRHKIKTNGLPAEGSNRRLRTTTGGSRLSKPWLLWSLSFLLVPGFTTTSSSLLNASDTVGLIRADQTDDVSSIDFRYVALTAIQEKDGKSGQEDKAQEEDPNAESPQEDSAQQPPAEKEADEPAAEDAEGGSEAAATDEDHDQAARNQRRRSRDARYLQFAKFNDHLKKLLKEQVKQVAESTVEVFVDENEEPSAMGTIVAANGFVMTKASSLNGRVSCRLSSGREVPAIVYGVDTATDLALLRVQASNLPAITWSLQNEKDALEGYWVLSPNSSGDLLSVGVVSVGPRVIPPVSGFVGITMGEHKEGVPINFIVPGSAAERYGLRISDLITRVEDIDVEKREDIQAILRTKRPGDVVSMNIKRGEVSLALQLVLGNREEDSPEAQRAITQNTMSGEISARRDGFPLAFQHDSVLDPQDCGGPVVDLDGRVIGLNIARSGRVKSYALPMSMVADVFERLATGEFSPEVVFAEQLEDYDAVLDAVAGQVSEINSEKSELDKEFEDQTKLIESTRSEVSDLKAKLKELEDQLADTEKKLDSEKTHQSQIKSQVRSKERDLEKAEKHKAEIESQRKQLLFGAN